MFLADLLMLLSLLIGTILYSCVHLSPLLNMICNTPILLLWTVGLALVTWNMYGALGRSCTINNWGNADGIAICNQYKALYAFSIIGWLCQVALIVLDVRARRNQSALGRYNKMGEAQDLKLDPLDHSRNSSVHNIPLGAGMDAASQRLQEREQQQQVPQGPLQRALTRASSFYSVAPSRAPTYTSQPRRQDVYQDAPYQSTSTQNVYQAYNPNPRFESSQFASTTNGASYAGYQPQAAQYDNYYERR